MDFHIEIKNSLAAAIWHVAFDMINATGAGIQSNTSMTILAFLIMKNVFENVETETLIFLEPFLQEAVNDGVTTAFVVRYDSTIYFRISGFIDDPVDL